MSDECPRSVEEARALPESTLQDVMNGPSPELPFPRDGLSLFRDEDGRFMSVEAIGKVWHKVPV